MNCTETLISYWSSVFRESQKSEENTFFHKWRSRGRDQSRLYKFPSSSPTVTLSLPFLVFFFNIGHIISLPSLRFHHNLEQRRYLSANRSLLNARVFSMRRPGGKRAKSSSFSRILSVFASSEIRSAGMIMMSQRSHSWKDRKVTLYLQRNINKIWSLL